LQGWFLKQPEKRGKWKRRFFTLTFTKYGSTEIEYFEKAAPAVAGGGGGGGGGGSGNGDGGGGGGGLLVGVKLKGSFCITAECTAEYGPGPGRDFLLAIHTAERVWRLTAEEQAQPEMWGRLIAAAAADAAKVAAGDGTDPQTRFACVGSTSGGSDGGGGGGGGGGGEALQSVPPAALV
jgi:hypothetical protein